MDDMRMGLIAPCGMNCRLCAAYQRKRKKCEGCNGDDSSKPWHCQKCVIKNCASIQSSTSGLCSECDKFPCRRLKQLDNRYQTKYKMSMIENLQDIRQYGVDVFLKNEKARWTCMECGNIVCVHNPVCPVCNNQHIR